MFDLRSYIKKGFLKAIGQMPEYKIRINSAGWLDKGVLLEEDLEEIENALTPEEEIIEEEIIDEEDYNEEDIGEI